MLEDVQHKFHCHILGFTLNDEPLSFIRDSEHRWLKPLRIRAQAIKSSTVMNARMNLMTICEPK